MARLTLEDGRRYDNAGAIAETLAPLGIRLQHWELPDDRTTLSLLDKETLNPPQRKALLAAVAYRFDQLKRQRSYTASDLVVLHDSQPEFGELATKFARPHTHADDEVRYILDGGGYFGLVAPDGRQALLEVEAGDCVTVPAGAEHWFEFGTYRRVKAVRYFTESSGWEAEFTGRIQTVRPLVPHIGPPEFASESCS